MFSLFIETFTLCKHMIRLDQLLIRNVILLFLNEVLEHPNHPKNFRLRMERLG